MKMNKVLQPIEEIDWFNVTRKENESHKDYEDAANQGFQVSTLADCSRGWPKDDFFNN